MASRTRGFAHRIDINATPAEVWQALCGPALLPKWLGADAVIRPRQGGTLVATVAPGLLREAMIDVFDEPRRLRLVYLPPPDLTNQDATVIDDILLEADGQSTIVRLLCSGMPDSSEWTPHFGKVRMLAERALARLKVLVERERQAATGSVG